MWRMNRQCSSLQMVGYDLGWQGEDIVADFLS
jgi:hypothetical protein